MEEASKESESVKAALLAEVGALVEIVELRGYVTDLKFCEAKLLYRRSAVMNAFNTSPEFYQIRIDGQFNRVFQANVTKLGVLSKDQARQIVRFHQLADSVRQDVIEGGVLAGGTDRPEMFREAIDLLEEAMSIGRAMIAADAEGGCSWFGLREAKK
ncbi:MULTISPECIES: hypothetical protein [unclassified Pseudomonas]|uniref:hypothetical protein n=1 Tax=unclassified Pseudomonas TaxID=196821 RepID=UPI000A1DE089|nr:MULTISPECIES: hypothetical protein [unclassified Pseudomonas]